MSYCTGLFGNSIIWENDTWNERSNGANELMDLSDIGVRHAVTFTTLNIRHSFDLSPSAVSIAREFRYCVIAVVVGLAITSITKNLLSLRKPSK